MAVLACLEASLGFITAKDCVILLIGAVFGCYASFVASQIVFWSTLKHDIFCHMELLTALLKPDSTEVGPNPYPLYRILEAKAIELVYQRHKGAYRECHQIADEMEQIFRRIRSSPKNDHWTDISSLKTKWLKRISALKPNPWAFLTPRKNARAVFEFYLPKEAEYVSRARLNIIGGGATVTNFEFSSGASD